MSIVPERMFEALHIEILVRVRYCAATQYLPAPIQVDHAQSSAGTLDGKRLHDGAKQIRVLEVEGHPVGALWYVWRDVAVV